MKNLYMKKLNPLLLLFIFSTVTLKIFAQPLTSGQIDALVERTMKTFDVTGIAVAVVKDGKIIHEKGYGVRSLKTMQKVNKQRVP